MKCKALIALGFIFVLSQTPLTAQADTFFVPGDFPTIKADLESVQSGDRIELSPGTYTEYELIFPEGISLIGMGATPAEVIIEELEFCGGANKLDPIVTDLFIKLIKNGEIYQYSENDPLVAESTT